MQPTGRVEGSHRPLERAPGRSPFLRQPGEVEDHRLATNRDAERGAESVELVLGGPDSAEAIRRHGGREDPLALVHSPTFAAGLRRNGSWRRT